MSALHIAVINNYYEIVQILLKYNGIDTNIKDDIQNGNSTKFEFVIHDYPSFFMKDAFRTGER